MNKLDALRNREEVPQLEKAAALGELGRGRTRLGQDRPRRRRAARPAGRPAARGPAYYPADTVTDQPLEDRLAEIVREKALAVTRQEVPHSIAVVVEELEDSDTLTKIHASLIVERDSQKGIVIGKGGETLKTIGSRARRRSNASSGTRSSWTCTSRC